MLKASGLLNVMASTSYLLLPSKVRRRAVRLFRSLPDMHRVSVWMFLWTVRVSLLILAYLLLLSLDSLLAPMLGWTMIGWSFCPRTGRLTLSCRW